MKRYIFIVAAIALASVSCSKTYESKTANEGNPISIGTWTDNLTKAAMTDFAENDQFNVYGYKWKGAADSQSDQTTVFNGTVVKKTGASKWEYAGINDQKMKFWDPSFVGYTFFAAYPAGAVNTLTDAQAQGGLFTSTSQTYDGSTEKLLIAQKKSVEKTGTPAAFANPVNLVFKHTAALVDFQFKKHTDLTNYKVVVNSFKLANIRTTGTFTVGSYDGSNDPVGATVSEVAKLGWTPDATPTVNASTAAAAAAPYVLASPATSATGATANVNLLTGLVVMPQKFATGDGAQTFTIEYSITDESTDPDQVSTFTPAAIEINSFDTTDNYNDPANTANIGSWLPGVHYTFIITINANGIEFSASIADWVTTDATGHYYLVN